MKTFRKLLTYFFIVFSLAACKKDFLAEDPYTFYSADGLYSSVSGANSVLNGAYNAIAGYDLFSAGYNNLLAPSSLGFITNQTVAVGLNSLEINPSTQWISQVWFQSYFSIARVNDILAKLPPSQIDQNAKNNILGQAYFLRGMLYFNLVRLWGGVPLRLQPTNASNLNEPRAHRDSVYAQIIRDLKMAEELLPLRAQQTVGRPNKYAANSLLGKVYIQLAGNNPSSPNWQLAKDEFLKVVNSNTYSLVPKFGDLWDNTKENTSESIFEVQFSSQTAGQWTIMFGPQNASITPSASTGQPFGRLRVNKEIYNDHNATYPNDPRIQLSYLDSSYTNKVNGAAVLVYPLNTTSQGWPYLIKWNDPAFVSNNSNRNFIYLRYADVLLSLAEAENEINGPANAYQYVNQVLTRARNSITPAAAQPANWSGMTKEQFRDRIMLERRFELIGEMHMWYDIRRRGLDYFYSVIDHHNTNPNFSTGYDVVVTKNERSILLPIPADEMNTNLALTNTDQNPGY